MTASSRKTSGGTSRGYLAFATKDFRVWRNTFTFIAKSEDNGKKIECTATNKVGSANSVSERRLTPQRALWKMFGKLLEII